jgi:predicted alpha-1,2-mannosidase
MRVGYHPEVMKKLSLHSHSPWLPLLLALSACAPADGDEEGDFADPIPWVDTFIGTGGLGFGQGSSYPGAASPFGLVAISPDTRTEGAHVSGFHNGGYWYEDHLITGFSHIHLQGTGAPDYGSVLFYPADGFSLEHTDSETRVASFSHDNEDSSPGWYEVTFDNGIRTQIAAGQRVGVHRYHFPEGMDPTVVIDLEHQMEPKVWDETNEMYRVDASIDIDPDSGAVTGTHQTAGALSGRSYGFLVHLWAEFDPPPSDWGTWADADPEQGGVEAQGQDLGGWLSFEPQAGGTTVTVRVGISYVSTDNAQDNWEAEAEGLDLEGLQAQTEQAWREMLGRIRVQGGTDRERTIFYSSLYRSMLMPNLRSDADGSYVGFDGAVHVEPEEPFYSDMSFWDTYRTAHPLYDLAYPEHARHFASSLVRMAAQSGGCLPRWPCGSGDSGSMIGDPADIVLSDTWIKGIHDFDVDAAWTAAQLCADGPRPDAALYGGRSGIDGYLGRGWVFSDEHSGSVARTMEYGWADAAMATWAEALGYDEQATRYGDRSRYYLNLWDPETAFFRARDSQGAMEPLEDFDELAWQDEYTEGNAWQYLWLAPADADRLADRFGGPDAFLERLDEFFERSTEEEDDIWPELYYWHGNEPDIHAPYLYALLGQPGRGAPWVQWVRETRYGTGADGVDGNDDGGTLSAWYVLSALGIYPIAGTEIYALGPPVFERAELDHMHGTLGIEATGARWTARGTWLGADLDGVPIEGGTLTHDELAADTVLRFHLAPESELIDSDREPLR